MCSFRTYIVLVLFIVSCGKQITSDEVLHEIEIGGAYISYSFDEDSNANKLIAQLDLSLETPLENIVNIWFDIELSGNTVLTEFLYDDGSNGDIIPDNGSYNFEEYYNEDVLSDNIYDVSFYILTIDEGVYILQKSLAIGEFPPTINLMCLPDLYIIPEESEDHFEIYVSISDPNGSDDIESVMLQIKKLEGYQTGEMENGSCIWSEEVDEEFIDVLIEGTSSSTMQFVSGWILDDTDFPCSTSETDNSLEYLWGTGLTVTPLLDCGPKGPIAFRFVIIDKSGYEIISDEHIMNFCHSLGDCL